MMSETMNDAITTADKPAIRWVTPHGKAWKHIIALVKRDATGEARILVMSRLALNGSGVADRRDAANHIIADRTGYKVLATTEDYADAMKVATEDKILYRALAALLDAHVQIITERKAVERKSE